MALSVLHTLIILSLLSRALTQYAHILAVQGKGEIGLARDGYHLLADAETDFQLLLIGESFNRLTTVRFTPDFGPDFASCDDVQSTRSFPVNEESVTSETATVDVILPSELVGSNLQICTKRRVNETDNSGTGWIYQSNESWVTIRVTEQPGKMYLMPLPVQVLICVLLLSFSGLFSGLNLGLMSLDVTELQIVAKCGSVNEQRYAKVIQPVRKHGNYLLCTILLGNVLVNNTLTILLDNLTGSGLIAVLSATLCIVTFGEIVPQAVCSRHGLAVGAKTIWFTKFFMVVTFPLSFPISALLNCILGQEDGVTYNRDRLRELLLLTQHKTDLVKNEISIIAGALELSKKTVIDVMTPLEDVFMVEYNAVLDFDTMTAIMQSGYTRIPVYEKERQRIVAMLNMKDLGLADPSTCVPLKTVCRFYNRPLNFVFHDTKLDVMLEEFKKGDSHISVVQKIVTKGDEDPYYETVGVVTLEDVIEEIIQSEIVDETDIITDNRKKLPRTERRNVSFFNQVELESPNNSSALSPQMTLAVFQYLSTSVDYFSAKHISAGVLQRMLKKPEVEVAEHPGSHIYQRGKASDFFCLILQGQVKVQMGQENITFHGGPFTYFGTGAFSGITEGSMDTEYLKRLDNISKTSQFIPDFDVEVLETTTYLRISRSQYLSAIRTTLLENYAYEPDITNHQETMDHTENFSKQDPDIPQNDHVIREEKFYLETYEL